MHYKTLVFKLTGNEFADEKYNIDYMIKGLICSQKMLEKSYLTLIDRINFTENDRNNMKIYAKNIRDGSFEAELVIFVKDITLSLFPMFANSSAKEVWDLAKNTYDYLKAIFLANKRRESIVVNITDSNGVTIVQNNDGTIVNAGRDVYKCANKTYLYLKEFSESIDKQKGFDGFILSDPEDKANQLEITEYEREIFKNEPFLEDKEIVFKGIYVNARVSTFSGRIEITDPMESNLEEQFYNFDFIDKNNEKLFREGYVEEREYVALKRVEYNIKTLKKDVVGLRILKVMKS